MRMIRCGHCYEKFIEDGGYYFIILSSVTKICYKCAKETAKNNSKSDFGKKFLKQMEVENEQ